ncbi:hypothetical protein PPACK8108_LOCUS23584 [Phakopsora pachyrhizi]|uniref:Uncharacterized protein n=1 Tax=Phakopsora pachyrhizi TaxID=170000 RepID=A0AAV0BPM7_PHAPC|nr:hypothetical protein PPACK8108_LOCUS23584 [Phakopsora pachyrhizi]
MDSQSNTSHIVFGANNFVWTKLPKDFICIMLHQLLISTDVESYTKGTDSESRILKNILVQDSNPEHQIPRLIELAKMLLEWAAPKGTSYSNKEIKDQFRYYEFIFEINRYLAKKKQVKLISHWLYFNQKIKLSKGY